MSKKYWVKRSDRIVFLANAVIGFGIVLWFIAEVEKWTLDIFLITLALGSWSIWCGIWVMTRARWPVFTIDHEFLEYKNIFNVSALYPISDIKPTGNENIFVVVPPGHSKPVKTISFAGLSTDDSKEIRAIINEGVLK